MSWPSQQLSPLSLVSTFPIWCSDDSTSWTLPLTSFGLSSQGCCWSRLILKKSSVVGVALIALYSRYLQLVQKNPAQLSLFILDQLRSEFSALGEMIRERVSEGELLQVYEVSGRAPSIDVDPAPDSGFITVLTRRKRTGGLEADRGLRSSLYRLPKTIWIRQSVLSAEKRPSAT